MVLIKECYDRRGEGKLVPVELGLLVPLNPISLGERSGFWGREQLCKLLGSEGP